MKKFIMIIFAVVTISTMIGTVSSCGHEHIWTNATCTEASLCKKCKKVNQPATGHNFEAWITEQEATCVSDGLRTRKCNCGTTESEVISATGHNFAEWTTVEEATCVSDGLRTRKCDCGHTESEVISASEEKHKFTFVTEEPTCTVDGLKTTTCAYCDFYGTTTIEARGYHVFGDWETTKEATCSQKGTSTRMCIFCEESESRSDSKVDHNYVDGYCKYCNKGIVTITFPESPVSVQAQTTSYFWVTVAQVTSFSWEYQYESDDEVVVKIYWFGERTYYYSGSCKLKYTIYDSEGYGITSGTSTSPDVSYGAKFKGNAITVYGLKKGESYTFAVKTR